MEARLLTAGQVATALQAQRLLGGRFGTNLLELGYLDDQSLADSLSRQLGVPKVAVGELAQVPPALLEKIPGPVACRLGVMPVREEAARATVAMLDPTDGKLLGRLSGKWGKPVEPRVMTEVEFSYHLEKCYHWRRDLHHLKIMEKLLDHSAESPGQRLARDPALVRWLCTIGSPDEALVFFLKFPEALRRVPCCDWKKAAAMQNSMHPAVMVLTGRIDGLANIEDLLVLSPFDRITTLRILAEFIRSGAMELQDP